MSAQQIVILSGGFAGLWSTAGATRKLASDFGGGRAGGAAVSGVSCVMR